jgi:exopolysaccharide production protein ExoQ
MSTSIVATDLLATEDGGRPPIVIAWLVFCASVTGILLGSFVGSAGAYAFLALWTILGGMYARTSVRFLTAYGIIWVFPGFALMSALWSQEMAGTLKYGAEYAGTAGCAVLAAALLSPRQIISALMSCLLLTAILSIVFGRSGMDPMTGVTTFIGVFESKNELGFFVSIMLLGSLALILDSRQPVMFRLMGLLALGLDGPLLIMTRSGTSQVTAVLASGVLIGNFMVSRLSRFGRARLLFAFMVIMLPSMALLGVAGDGVHDFVVNVMGKDTTLTGRTLLWQHALTLIPQHPFLGSGFQAFWRHNDVEAESLWSQFHVLSRQGFHFHSTYIEALIEVGFIGTAALASTVLAVMAGVVRWSWCVGSVPASFFVSLMVCLLIRSFVEVDMMFQFQIGTFLLFMAAYYACLRPVDTRRR